MKRSFQQIQVHKKLFDRDIYKQIVTLMRLVSCHVMRLGGDFGLAPVINANVICCKGLMSDEIRQQNNKSITLRLWGFHNGVNSPSVREQKHWIQYWLSKYLIHLDTYDAIKPYRTVARI